ncbi:MAG: right-handed parallel beta-helix repeat-containing protein [Anaerolineae bacterium]|nr:right-handed parallel beta-helix repeat-containing protein [Anaerolineae bacterium]
MNAGAANFRLRSGSPCIGTAHPTAYAAYDFDGYARPFGARADIGAHEYYTGHCFARLMSSGRVYTTVQEAVGAAVSSGLPLPEVRVAGVCRESVVLTGPLTLLGGYAITRWASPISPTYLLAPAGGGRVLYITGPQTSTITVGEFVIRGGNVNGNGGGIYIATPLSPTIRNVVLYNNSATGNGGGLASVGGNPRLYNNTVVNNAAAQGGGLYFAAGRPVISNTIVVSNTGGGIRLVTGTATLAYNNVWHNSGYNYSGLTAGATDISENPRFVNPATGNFRLRPDSACVHSGDPHTALSWDFEGDERPLPSAGLYDIGADESTSYLGVDLGPATLYHIAGPGEVVRFAFVVTNTGTLQDAYVLTHTLVVSGGSSSGWIVSYTPVYTVASAGTVQTPVYITIPLAAASNVQATLYLTAASRSNPAYFHDTAAGLLQVRREWGVEIGPAYSSNANPGTKVVYVHTLTNTGNARDTFNLFLNSSLGLAQMWPTRVENLGVGQTARVYVTVTVPAYAAGGAVEHSLVRAESVSGPASDSVENMTRINYVSGNRYVSLAGTDALNNCRLTTRPCRTIGQALAQAASGDEIRVAGGTYNEYNLTINKPLILLAGYDANFAARDPQARPTVIDAGCQGRVLYIFGNATVDGFTLRNGCFNGPGGGVYAVNAPTLRNNIIISNTAIGNRGGGVYNADGNLTLEGNILANNRADMGGGFYNYRGNPVIQYNTFRNNYAASRGGGLYNTGIAGAAPRVWTNIFYGNRAGIEGGGVYNLSGNSLIWHNTLYSNTNDGIFVAGGAPVISNTIVVSNTGWGIRGTALTVDYNDVWGNSSGNYGSGISAGPNSISADPLFLDARAGDFHLREGSPCIERGGPTNAAVLKYDLDGQPRVMGNRPDIGADEFQRLGVALHPTAARQPGWPGQPLTYTHVLTNEGNYTDTFAITWSNQWPGWNVAVNGVTTQPLNIALGQGATTTLYVRVTPTNLFSGTTNVTIITATSVIAQSDPETYLPVYATAADTTIVRRAWGVALEPDRYGWGSSAANERVIYLHVLTNTGNYTDSFTITWSNNQVPPGCTWPVILDTPANTGPVGQGMTKTVQVSVYVPGCASVGTGVYANTLVLTATSNSKSNVKDIVTDITVSNWQHGLQFAPSRSGTNWPGTKVHYTHVITNTGNYTDTFVINYASSRGWEVAVSPRVVTVGGWPTPRPAGAVYTATVYVTVTIPPLGVAFGGEVERTVITATSRTNPTLKRSVVDTTTAKQVGGALFVHNYDDTPAPNKPAVRVYNPTTNPRTVVFVHTLTNLGNGRDVFDLSVSSLKGWPVTISPAPTVALGYQGSVTVFITLTTPGPGTPYPFPAPWDRVVATATSRFDPTIRDTVTDIAIVNQTPGVRLSSGYAQSAQPGWVTYTHILTNTGNYTDSFRLTYSGWQVVFSGDLNNVGPGMTRTVYARVSVPYQQCGTVGTSVITATSVYSPAVSAAILDVTTVAPVYAVALDTVRPVRALADRVNGGTAVYNHNVTNIGNCAGVFRFQGVQSDPHFTPTVTPVSRTIPFQGQTRITVTVDISPTDSILAGTVVITAAGPSGGGAAVTDTIIVNQIVDLDFAPDRAATNHTGGAVAFTHMLTNAGNYTDTFYLSWWNADGWNVSVQPPVVSNLGPGASRPVTVVVNVHPTVYTRTNRTIITATTDVLPWEQTRAYAPKAAVVDTLLVRRPHVVIAPAPGYTVNMDPGTSATLYHTLTNDGGLIGTYRITSTRRLGWIGAVSLTVSNLPPGASFPFTVPVVVPYGTWGLYDIAYITATEIYSGVFATARDIVTAPYRYDVMLLPSTRDSAVVPPAVVVYTHTLKNTGNYTTTYMLAADGEFSSASVVPAVIYNLGPGQTRPITVTIAVPFEAAAGDVEDTRIAISFSNKQVHFYDTVHINYATGTRYVDRNGWDERNNCRTSTAPCATVQHAVNQASPGDEIRVAAGTYYDELLAGQVVRVDKSVTLRGGYDANDWDSAPDPVLRPTVLHAAGQLGRRVVVIGAGITPTVEGFHITGGYVNGNGAGIYIEPGAAPTIRACYIYDNRAAGTGNLGAGIYYAGGAAPLFERNRIYENRASEGSGGGIYLAGGDSRLFNNIIYRNRAGTCGGGLCNAAGTPLVYNNTFYSNTVSDQMGGGGIGSLAGTLVVSNTIVARNTGTGIRVVGGTPPRLSYNDVWGNTPVDYECRGCARPTDISADPVFADAGNDDFHLTSASPCVDAGDPRSMVPTNDHEDNPRPLPIGGRYDIGAYEYGLGGGKIADRPTANPSSRITYTVQVYNTTANPQTFPVTDTLHPYLTYVPGSLVSTGGTARYVTATRTVSWVVTVPANAGESIAFTAVVTDWAGSDVVITNVAWINLAPANVVSVSVSAVPSTRYVAPDGVDRHNGCNLPWRPCATVQRAVDQAVSGDTVLVASGTYGGAGLVATVNKSITLIGGYTRTGSYTATVWSYAPELYPTVLNGGLRINGPASVVVDGFRITGGSDGVYVAGSGGHLTLRRCWVYNNTSNGVRVENGTYTLINNVIARNGSGAGAGLRTTNSTGVLIHNTFGHNNNRAAVIGGTAIFTNTIFANHTVGLDIPAGSKATIQATLWWQNVMNQVYGQLIVRSINLTGDPSFVNPTGLDYHIGGDSAAIDQGVDAGVGTDIDRDLRPILAGFDIGADEYPVGFTKVGPATAIAGQTITYVITMRAKDPDLVITDVLPMHLTFTPGTDIVTCTLGTCRYRPDMKSIIWAGNTVTEGQVIITYTASLTNWLAAGTVITNGAVLNREGILVNSEVWATQIVAVPGTRYVTKTGTNRDAATGTYNNCLIPWKPCATLQYAVDQAQHGDTIKVATGVYTDVQTRAGTTQNVHINKSVTIRGGYTTTNWAVSDPQLYPTVIDAVKAGRTLYAVGPATITVEALELRNGYYVGNGGGVYVTNAALTLSGSSIRGSRAVGTGRTGGGIYAQNAVLTLVDTRVYSNSSVNSHGGGVDCTGGTVKLIRAHIYSNTVNAPGSDGGGVYCTGGSFEMNASRVYKNSATGYGGGLYLQNAVLTINDSMVHHNYSASGGGGLYLRESEVTLFHNRIYTNTAASSGGGLSLYICPKATLDANWVLDNSAGPQSFHMGGGIYIWGSGATVVTMTNNVVAANRAGGGGDGIYAGGNIGNNTGRFRHTTIADNDGEGLRVDAFNFSIEMINTILSRQAKGIVTNHGSAVVGADYTLWDGVGTKSDNTGGGIIFFSNDLLPNADPKFRNRAELDYHLLLGSPAVDRGRNAGVDHDIDGDARPQGGGFDVGADELYVRVEAYKTAFPDPVEAGATVTYTIYVTNVGSVDVHAVITDILPPQLSAYVPLTWTANISALGQVWTRQFTATVSWGYSGTLTNRVRVTTREGASDEHVTISRARVTPGVSLVKRAYPDPVEAGGVITYTILVTNTGNTDLRLTITDTLPAQVTTTQPLVWRPVVAAPGGTWRTQFTATVSWSYSGTLTNTVRAVSAEGAAALHTMTSRARVTPAMVVSKRASSDLVRAGERLTYTITVTNTGNTDLHLTVIDTLPTQGTTTLPFIWTPVVTAPGGVWVGTVVITVASNYDGPIVNRVDVEAQEGPRATAYVTTTVKGPASLSISKSVMPGSVPVRPGDLLTYTLRASNAGPGVATAPVMRDMLPANTTYRSCSGGVSCNFSAGQVVWALGTLPAGGQAIVTFTVQVNSDVVSGTTIVNQTYGITCTEGYSATGAPVSVPVGVVGGVAISGGQVRTAFMGEVVTYTHRITNTANIVQTLSIAFSSSQGWATVTPTTIPSLAPLGGSAVVTVTVAIPATGVVSGTVERTTITVTGSVIGRATATDITTAAIKGYFIYLPVVLRKF